MMTPVTADEIAAFRKAGRGSELWWHAEYGAVPVREPLPVGAVYLMPWDQAWFDQWGGDWSAAADQINGLLLAQGLIDDPDEADEAERIEP